MLTCGSVPYLMSLKTEYSSVTPGYLMAALHHGPAHRVLSGLDVGMEQNTESMHAFILPALDWESNQQLLQVPAFILLQ